MWVLLCAYCVCKRTCIWLVGVVVALLCNGVREILWWQCITCLLHRLCVCMLVRVYVTRGQTSHDYPFNRTNFILLHHDGYTTSSCTLIERRQRSPQSSDISCSRPGGHCGQLSTLILSPRVVGLCVCIYRIRNQTRETSSLLMWVLLRQRRVHKVIWINI